MLQILWAFSEEDPPRKKIGRPKGSVSRPKGESAPAPAPGPIGSVGGRGRGRGRPPGSGRRPALASSDAVVVNGASSQSSLNILDRSNAVLLSGTRAESRRQSVSLGQSIAGFGGDLSTSVGLKEILGCDTASTMAGHESTDGDSVIAGGEDPSNPAGGAVAAAGMGAVSQLLREAREVERARENASLESALIILAHAFKQQKPLAVQEKLLLKQVREWAPLGDLETLSQALDEYKEAMVKK